MRDINRINPFLDELAKIWGQVPDWRFGQLICNMFRIADMDPFYMEEEQFLSCMKKMIYGMNGEEE